MLQGHLSFSHPLPPSLPLLLSISEPEPGPVGKQISSGGQVSDSLSAVSSGYLLNSLSLVFTLLRFPSATITPEDFRDKSQLCVF